MSDEEDDDVVNATGIMRWIPTIMLVSVVTGFIMIASYAYHAGKQEPLKDDELLVVEADKAPIKEKPEDPGGMKFPNQDKTIFETFSNNPAPAKVERVLPPPEEPITSNDAPVTDSHSSEADKPKTESTESVVKSDKADEVKKDEAVNEEKKDAPVEVAKVEAISADDKKAEAVKPAAEAKTTPAKPKASEQKTATAKPAAKTGGVKIQLGAYASEKEANETWQKIQKKFPSIAGKTPSISHADVKGKTFYRLRLGGFADKASAGELCKNLTAKGQGCMLAVD